MPAATVNFRIQYHWSRLKRQDNLYWTIWCCAVFCEGLTWNILRLDEHWQYCLGNHPNSLYLEIILGTFFRNEMVFGTPHSTLHSSSGFCNTQTDMSICNIIPATQNTLCRGFCSCNLPLSAWEFDLVQEMFPPNLAAAMMPKKTRLQTPSIAMDS